MSLWMSMGFGWGAEGGTILEPATRGPMTPNHGIVYARQRLPDDPIGTFLLTLDNIVIGSRWRVEVASTGDVAASPGGDGEGEADASPEVLTLYLYPQGNPRNDLRIIVRKGTAAPKYLPFESFATAAAGGIQVGVSVYIAQVPDQIA